MVKNNIETLMIKWQKEMDESIESAMKYKEHSPNRLIFLAQQTTISDCLEDLKKLNEVTVRERDLLIDFVNWCDDDNNTIDEGYVDAYLADKSINKCGRIES